MKQFFTKRPWIWIVFAFVVLITAWSIFINIAINHQPEKVPLEFQPESGDARD